MSIGCRIAQDIKEGNRKLAELFRNISVASIDDCMNRLAAFDADIRPINNTPMLGCAFTVKVAEGDNLMMHKALDMARPGDVLVVASGKTGNRAIFGELMSEYCRVRGLAGIVTDGLVRDSDTLEQYTDFAVYAAGTTPNGPYKNGPGEIGYPVVIGGQLVNPGDIIVGDRDGILAIPPENAQEIYEAVMKVLEKEKQITANIKKGSYVRPWVDAKLHELGVE